MHSSNSVLGDSLRTDKSLSSKSDAPVIFFVSDLRDTLSIGLRDRWVLSVSIAVVGCDVEGGEKVDGGLDGGLNFVRQDACPSDPQETRRFCSAAGPSWLLELEQKQ